MSFKDTLPSGVLDLIPYQAGKTIEQISREVGVEVNVKLSSNENPLGSSPKALEVLCNPKNYQPNYYPDASAVLLRQAIAKRLNLHEDLIICGNGSNDLLEISATLALRPGKKAVYSEHGFVVYKLATHARGAQSIVVPAKNFGHDLEAFAIACQDKDVGIVFIANPNNPTGTYQEMSNIKSFISKVSNDILIVIDEAYQEYAEDGIGESLDLINNFDNVLITRTFSKIHGLAGLRIGYGIASAELLALLNRVRQPFNANAAAQAAATAAINDQEFINKSIKVNDNGMLELMTGLSNLGYVTIPSQGNFLSFNCDNGTEMFNTLLKGGVIVRQIDEYNLPNWLRVTVGDSQQNQQFLTALPKRST